MAKRASPFSQQMAAFDYTEQHAKSAKRVTDSVCIVLDSRCGQSAREAVFWNLSMTSNLGQGEISDRPAAFMEGLTAIYVGAARALEDAMVEALQKEFSLEPLEYDANNGGREGFVDVLNRAGNVPAL